MSPKPVAFPLMLCSLLFLEGCKKQSPVQPPAKEATGDQQASEGDPNQARGHFLLGEVKGDKLLRKFKTHDIEFARKEYELAKSAIASAQSSGAIEKAKLEAIDKRDKISKLQAEYDQMLAEDREKIAEAKKLLGDGYEEDDVDLLRDAP